MDIRKVKKLIELLEASDVAEIEIKEGDDAVRISRAPSVAAGPMTYQAAPAPSLSAEAPKESEASTPEYTGKGNVIQSPMVGTFYRAPSPSSAPFVEVGTQVKAGDVVCIIEAMKVMNQIKAEKSGVIQRILVDDASSVEFGQGLFVIA